MKNNQKGITLIALVITIIVLIILAAVSIAMLTGDSGILTNADDAREDTNSSAYADKINMELNAFKTELLADKEISRETFSKAVTALGTTDYEFKIGNTVVDPASHLDTDEHYNSVMKPASNPPTTVTISSKNDSTVTGSISLTDRYTITKATYTKASDKRTQQQNP